MQSRIYSRLFNLKDRQDLPANNPAIPFPQANAYDGSGDEPAPVAAPSPYTPPVPKPPQGRAAQPAATAVVDEYVATPEADLEANYALADNTFDEEEKRRLAEVAASATGQPRTAAEERRLQSVLRKASKAPAKTGTPDPNAIWSKQSSRIREADAEMVKQRQLPDDSQFAVPAGAPNAPEPVNYAASEAKLNEQARMGLLAPPEMRPGSAKDQKKADKEVDYQERLKAALTYENPKNATEKAQNKRDQLQFERDNPRNKDHGVKGFIRETLQNFLFGLSKAQGVPGISIPQALMLGGVGAGGGMINRSWNEQRQAESDLGGATEELTYQTGLEDKRRGMDARDASIGIRDRAEQRQTEKNLVDADYKMKSLGIQEKYRNEYLDLLRSRDVYKNANDKKKADQAQQRIDILEKQYKLNEKKAGVAIGKSVIDTMDKQQAALKKIDARLKEAESAGDTEQIAKLKAARAQAEAYKFNQ